jgi:hydrogenase expression/formation protein HypE
VPVVTGDTKVVPHDAMDGLVITTSGVGEVHPSAKLGFECVRPGDRLLLSGPPGEHGMAVMCQRKGLSLLADMESDCAALHEPALELVEKLGGELRFMRDPTRGGLAGVLNDLAAGTNCDIQVDERTIPVNRTARAAAEMLGLDLLTVANEGKLLAVVSAEAAEQARQLLAGHEVAQQAAVIGTVGDSSESSVVEIVTAAGGRRIVQMPYGEELPRIC